MTDSPKPQESDKPKPSEWLAKVLEHCDRATEKSLATLRALGKSSSKIRKAVGK